MPDSSTPTSHPNIRPWHVVCLGILAMISTAAGYVAASASSNTVAAWLNALR